MSGRYVIEVLLVSVAKPAFPPNELLLQSGMDIFFVWTRTCRMLEFREFADRLFGVLVVGRKIGKSPRLAG